jgi:hypothetical protein
MMHMVVVFLWRFDGVCGARQGWVGLDAVVWMAPLTREGTIGQNVYYEVILSGPRTDSVERRLSTLNSINVCTHLDILR